MRNIVTIVLFVTGGIISLLIGISIGQMQSNRFEYQIINEYKQDCKPMYEDATTYLQCETRSVKLNEYN